MKKKFLCFAFLCTGFANAQTAVQAGAGSFASIIPQNQPWLNPTDQSNFFGFYSSNLNVLNGEARPIPTNDWWTDVLFPKSGVNANFAGFLHAYPATIQPRPYGCELFFLNKWEGQDMARDFPLAIKGTNFNPAKNIAKNWNDWGVTVNLQDGAKSMDITMNNGSPMAWFEITNFDPTIDFGNGATFFKDDGTAQTFPFTGSSFGVLSNGKLYSIYTATGTQFSLTGTTVMMTNTAIKKYFTVATLKTKSDLAYYRPFAYCIPRNTRVTWSHNLTQGKVTASWAVTTENLSGGAERRIVQGFLPHHYKRCQSAIVYNGREYETPRGLMKCATGNNFTFTYDFSGISSHTPQPLVRGEANPYSRAKVTEMLRNLENIKSFDDETYKGTKDLFDLAKAMVYAKELADVQSLTSLKATVKKTLVDWLTYSGANDTKYFARNEKYKALIGFKPGYGSDRFNDHHFHYGYLIHAAALYGTLDRQFLTEYAPMLKLVVKEYANWDRADNTFPFLRTFSPWNGLSFAGGTGGGDGNNQESSSEAMNSWAGMYLLGDLLGDNGMRSAAAFGYTTEARAIREYYLDVDDQNFPDSYPHKSIGILWTRGMQYGTYFSGAAAYIHGIQWLPQSVAMDYLGEYPDYLTREYNIMLADQQSSFNTDKANNPQNFDPTETLNEYNLGDNGGWGNVFLNFLQITRPAYVAQKFDEYWNISKQPINNNKVQQKITNIIKDPIAIQTYWNTHSRRTLGNINYNYHTSAPNSQVYFNTATNTFTYVGFNAAMTQQVISVYNGTSFVESFVVPPFSPFNVKKGDIITNPGTNNLALRKIPVVSSTENTSFTAANATDGIKQDPSRWASDLNEPKSFLYVDLGATYDITRINLFWETAFASSYKIYVSTDNIFTENEVVFSTTTSNGANDDITINPTNVRTGRFVRINCESKGTIYGYSLYEFEVYGNAKSRVGTSDETEISSSDLGLYPNPVSNFITLQFPLKVNNKQVIIYDLYGKIMLEKKLNSEEDEHTFNIDKLSKGVYLLQLISDERVWSKRFIKQ
jgi:endoglucanase Acf2